MCGLACMVIGASVPTEGRPRPGRQSPPTGLPSYCLPSHLSCPHFSLSSLQPVSHTCLLSHLSSYTCPSTSVLQPLPPNLCSPHFSTTIYYICPFPHLFPYLSRPLSASLPLTHGTVEALAVPAGPSAWGGNKIAHSHPRLQTYSLRGAGMAAPALGPEADPNQEPGPLPRPVGTSLRGLVPPPGEGWGGREGEVIGD